MLAAAAAGASHPAVAAVLGIGAAGLAGGVVAMAWNVHAAQLRLAEILARRQSAPPARSGAAVQNGTAVRNGGPMHVANGNAVPRPAVGEEWERAGAQVETGPAGGESGPAGRDYGEARRDAGTVGREHGAAGREPGAARRQPGAGGRAAGPGGRESGPGGREPGSAGRETAARREAGGAAREPGRAARAGPAPVVIEGPDTVIIGEQARYRVQRSGIQQVVSWAAGGGSVSQSADPAHPDELLLVADQPGNLTVAVRVREGLTERRETKSVTVVPDPEAAAPRFVPRLFLQEWGLIAVAVLVVGFAGALVALGSLTSSDFIALAAPLAALLGVIAVTRGSSGSNSPPAARPGTPGASSSDQGTNGYGTTGLGSGGYVGSGYGGVQP